MPVRVRTFDPVTCSSANTAYPLVAYAQTRQYVTSVSVQAEATNVGKVYLGDSSVTTSNGVFVEAGDSIEITADIGGKHSDEFALDQVYVTSGTSGNAVRIIAFVREP